MKRRCSLLASWYSWLVKLGMKRVMNSTRISESAKRRVRIHQLAGLIDRGPQPHPGAAWGQPRGWSMATLLMISPARSRRQVSTRCWVAGRWLLVSRPRWSCRWPRNRMETERLGGWRWESPLLRLCLKWKRASIEPYLKGIHQGLFPICGDCGDDDEINQTSSITVVIHR